MKKNLLCLFLIFTLISLSSIVAGQELIGICKVYMTTPTAPVETPVTPTIVEDENQEDEQAIEKQEENQEKDTNQEEPDSADSQFEGELVEIKRDFNYSDYIYDTTDYIITMRVWGRNISFRAVDKASERTYKSKLIGRGNGFSLYYISGKHFRVNIIRPLLFESDDKSRFKMLKPSMFVVEPELFTQTENDENNENNEE